MQTLCTLKWDLCLILKFLIPLTNCRRSNRSYIHNSPFIHIHSLYTTMAAARGEYMNISNNYVKKEYPDVM